MKAIDKTHADLVRTVIKILRETDINEYVPHADSVIARAAADVVGQIAEQGLLAFGGEIHVLTGPPTRNEQLSGNGANVWHVCTTTDYSNQTCRWCGVLYGTLDPGGKHRLCKSCYKDGPPSE